MPPDLTGCVTWSVPGGRLTISVPEAGQMCGIGRDAAYAAAKRGEIPTLRLGRTLRVPVAKLLELLGATPTYNGAEPHQDSATATHQDFGGPGNAQNTVQQLRRA